MLRAKARAKAALSVQRYYQGMQGRRLYRRAKRRWQYNQANIYRDEMGVTTVLVTFRSQTKLMYDPRDDTVGMHFAAWLRRLGVLECYTPLTQHGMDSVELLCNANDKQLEAAGVESQADRDRILNFSSMVVVRMDLVPRLLTLPSPPASRRRHLSPRNSPKQASHELAILR